MRLDKKVILITGSSTGIGKAMAQCFASEGALLVITGLDVDLVAKTVEEIGSSRAVGQAEDLLDDGAPDRLVKLAVETFGRLDSVVNNAALIAQGNVHTTDAAFLTKMLAVNTVAPFLLIRAALPHLRKVRGSVLNIGSVNAWCGEPNLLPYSMSKGALMTMTRNLGDTLMREDGVRVNQINPGWVLTENETRRKQEHGLSAEWFRDLPKEYAPSGRILLPREIAVAAVYWLADESGPVSGQVMDLEQYPLIGRNPPKDTSTIPE